MCRAALLSANAAITFAPPEVYLRHHAEGRKVLRTLNLAELTGAGQPTGVSWAPPPPADEGAGAVEGPPTGVSWAPLAADQVPSWDSRAPLGTVAAEAGLTARGGGADLTSRSMRRGA